MQYFFKSPLIVAMRPWQWIKNIVILIPLIFSGKFIDIDSVLKSIGVMAIFCILSSAVYLINDIKDKEKDRFHPLKKNRPLASGLLSSRTAFKMAIILIIISLSLAYFVNLKVLMLVSIYLILMLLYTYFLKRIPILDLFVVSIGFVIRVLTGAWAINVQVSLWLLLITFSLALLLITGKRRYEYVVLQDEANNHRENLENYSKNFLDILIFSVAIAIITIYLFYVKLGNNTIFNEARQLIYTWPFVVAGVIRYLFIIYKHQKGGEPERILFSDWWMRLTFLGYGISLAYCYK